MTIDPRGSFVTRQPAGSLKGAAITYPDPHQRSMAAFPTVARQNPEARQVP